MSKVGVMKMGVLLINLGTPSSPSVEHVRTYLREFLSDPYVIDIHPIARSLLLNLIILPTRPKKSAKAYQSIWIDDGSPLLTYSLTLSNNTQRLLDSNYNVALGMRYGAPSISSAIEQLKNCEQLLIVPLFPQYSLAATETALIQAKSIARKIWSADKIQTVKDFYIFPGFINAQTKLIRDSLGGRQIDQLLFSYHGLPERQVRKICVAEKHCDMQQICPIVDKNNRYCYRAQCFATSTALAKTLNLHEDQYLTSFQSRLGRTPWIKPYTDKILIDLAVEGAKNIAIVCPSFVVDCLETLEEIGIRVQQQWLALGGENLYLIPCVNDNAVWLYKLIKSVTSTD